MGELISAVCPDRYISFRLFYHLHRRVLEASDYKVRENHRQGAKQVDYIWFLINPMKEKQIKRRRVKEFIRILCDHSKAPRDELTEMVEDHICGL